MKTKLLILLLGTCLLALTAWLVHAPKPAQADDIPEKYRDTVREGLEYLVKQQFPDGHWEGDGGKHPVAMTGLVGLALLMEHPRTESGGFGRIDKQAAKAKYAANIRKAADWLMEKSQPRRDGLIFSEHPSETARYMEGHGLATLFLAGVCRDESDQARRKKLTEVLTRAVKYIGKAQSSQGGWYHTSKVEGHDFDVISATAIQIQALQAAENAGIAIPGGTVDDALEYLKTAIGKYEKAKPEQNASRPGDTAAALACRFSPRPINVGKLNGLEMMDEWCKKWLKHCQAEIPVGRNAKLGQDELAHYYYAQTLSTLGGEAWGAYRTAMFDHLQSRQNKDGSWPAGNGISVGPIYSTALWCTVLQLDKGSHPSRRLDNGTMMITTRRHFKPWPGLRCAVTSAREPAA